MTDSQETARKIRQKNSRNVFAGFVSKRMRNDGGPASERRCRSRGRLVRGETRGRGGCAVDQSFSVVKRIAFFRLCSRSVLGRRESRHGAFHPETVKESLPCPSCRLSSSARSACSLPSAPGCTAPSDTIASIPSSCLERPRAASAARGLLRPSFWGRRGRQPFARVAETPKRRRVGAQADAALGGGRMVRVPDAPGWCPSRRTGGGRRVRVFRATARRREPFSAGRTGASRWTFGLEILK